MSTTRAIVNQATTVTFRTFADGTQTDLGTVTIGIVDAAGAVVVAAGTSVTDNNNGSYTYTLAAQPRPNVLTATWTVTGGASFKTTIEVVGSVLFSEVEARAFDNGAMADTTLYTDAAIIDGERAVSAMLERATKRSYVTRYCRVELSGSGDYSINLASNHAQFRAANGDDVGGPGRLRDIRRIISATDGNTTISPSDVVIDGSKLFVRSGVWGVATIADPLNVVIEYEYGLSGDDPEGVKRPALWLLRERLVPSDINGRATSYSDGLGTLRFETPGRNGNVSTIPEVNMWVKSQDMSTLVF